MELREILNSLYAEKKLSLSFSSFEDRESFRQKLYKAKKIQDKLLVDILDEDKKVLKCKYDDSATVTEGEVEVQESPHIATFWLEKKPKEQFSVVILEDTPANASELAEGSTHPTLSSDSGQTDL